MKKAVRIDHSSNGPVVVCHLTSNMLKADKHEITKQAAACAGWMKTHFKKAPAIIGNLDDFINRGVVR
ncbi:hypothetical protein [Desulfobacter sp.]|uniref:hypothetical protein n=1 Tax=Desulfobacter sp. TaxID=2294 RepID=UPI003D096658